MISFVKLRFLFIGLCAEPVDEDADQQPDQNPRRVEDYVVDIHGPAAEGLDRLAHRDGDEGDQEAVPVFHLREAEPQQHGERDEQAAVDEQIDDPVRIAAQNHTDLFPDRAQRGPVGPGILGALGEDKIQIRFPGIPNSRIDSGQQQHAGHSDQIGDQKQSEQLLHPGEAISPLAPHQPDDPVDQINGQNVEER